MKMKQVAVVMAGGNGTRLWPLSDRDHPKSLLEIFNKKSMLEQTVFRAGLFANAVFVLTSKEIYKKAQDVLNELGLASSQVITEPEGADTAAAIAYAVAQIKAIYGKKVVISLLPVDHRIKNHGAFYRDIYYATRAAGRRKSPILFGITPSFASTGYGYIQVGAAVEHKDRNILFKVKQFSEKPDKARAEEFLKSADHVWNSGIFIGSVKAFESAFRLESSLFEWYEALSKGTSPPLPEKFRDFQFERNIVQRIKPLYTLIATFDWVDIGTYSGLYSSVPEIDEAGNAVRGNAKLSDCQDCLVMGNRKKIVALGLKDIAIIDGPDGILVCKKSTHSQIVGKAATGKEQPGARR